MSSSACALALIIPALAIGATPRIVVQKSDPPLAALVRDLVPLCEDWYPKIGAILYGVNPPAPPPEIRILFDEEKIAGRTEGNRIHLSAAEAKRSAKLDFRAVVIHELVHIVQAYTVPARCHGYRILGCVLTRRYYGGPSWLSEGIAGYVTYTAFTGTNKPRLQLDATGQLLGYDESIPCLHGLQQSKLPVDGAYGPRGVQAGKGYQHGYTVAASFLLWLEQNKDRQIVRKRNVALKTKSYSGRIWRQLCGVSVDQLWAQFLSASKQSRPS